MSAPPPPKRSLPPPDECAQCGATLPRNALSCPECGADERTGWRETSPYDGLDLPDSAWDDDHHQNTKNSQNTNVTHTPYRIGGIPWYWAAVALTLVLLMILFSFGV